MASPPAPPDSLSWLSPALATPGRGAGADLPDVPLEHLDYGYVATCTNARELKTLLDVCRSGREGKYPNLEDAIERRMLEVMTPAERDRYAALTSQPSPADRATAMADVQAWLRTMAAVRGGDATKPSPRAATTGGAHLLPPPRSAKPSDAPPAVVPVQVDRADGAEGGGKPPAPPTAHAPARPGRRLVVEEVDGRVAEVASDRGSLHGDGKAADGKVHGEGAVAPPSTAVPASKRDPKAKPFGTYYNEWAAYDADAALARLESEEKGVPVAVVPPSTATMATVPPAPSAANATTAATHASQVRVASEVAGAGKDGPPTTQAARIAAMPAADRLAVAERERVKGNEFMASNDFDRAAYHYSQALLYDATSAAAAKALCNRAQAHLKQRNWVHAEADCDAALALDATYVKAWMRRGVVRMKRGNHAGATTDFNQAVALDPHGPLAAQCASLAKEAAKEATPLRASTPASMPKAAPTKPVGTTYARPGGRSTIIEEIVEEDAPTGAAHPAPATPTSTPPALPTGAKRVTIMQADEEDEEEDEEEASKEQVKSPVMAHAAPTPASTTTAAASRSEGATLPSTAHPPPPATLPPPTPPPAPAPAPISMPWPVARLREVERHKEAGNGAFQRGDFPAAVDHYTRALAEVGATVDAMSSGTWAVIAAETAAALRAHADVAVVSRASGSGVVVAGVSGDVVLYVSLATAVAALYNNRALAHLKTGTAYALRACATDAHLACTVLGAPPTTVGAILAAFHAPYLATKKASLTALLDGALEGVDGPAPAWLATVSLPDEAGGLLHRSAGGTTSSLTRLLQDGTELDRAGNLLRDALQHRCALPLPAALAAAVHGTTTPAGGGQAPISHASLVVKAWHRRALALEGLGHGLAAHMACAVAMAMEPGHATMVTDYRRLKALASYQPTPSPKATSPPPPSPAQEPSLAPSPPLDSPSTSTPAAMAPVTQALPQSAPVMAMSESPAPAPPSTAATTLVSPSRGDGGALAAAVARAKAIAATRGATTAATSPASRLPQSVATPSPSRATGVSAPGTPPPTRVGGSTLSGGTPSAVTALEVEGAVSSMSTPAKGAALCAYLLAHLPQPDVALPALFRRPLEPDMVTTILAAVTDDGGAVTPAPWVARLLTGILRVPGWPALRDMMMPTDRQRWNACTARVQADGACAGDDSARAAAVALPAL